MSVRTLVIARLLVVASSAGLLCGSSMCQQSPADNPARVTILDLASHPRKYDGQLVQLDALLALSWEGDNFLSEPNPQAMPPDGQAYIWLYCKPENEHNVFDPIMFSHYGSVYGSFIGYFHFVEKPHIINGAFYPGPLQFEAVRALVPDPQRMSLAEDVFAKSRRDRGFTGQLLVLVDSDSASASEVFARVMQIEKRGKIIGDVTAGKVMAGEFLNLLSYRGVATFSVFGLEITMADLVMSDGQRLERAGVVPDKAIGPTSRALAEKTDPVLAYAASAFGVQLSAENAGEYYFMRPVPEPGEEPGASAIATE